MRNQTVVLTSTKAKILVAELNHLEKVKKTILRMIPASYLPEGSDLWWAKSDLEALVDIKEKRYKSVATHRELDQLLDSLK